MAGEKVSDYSIGDPNLTSLMLTVDAQRLGYHGVSLTNFDNTSKPAIAEGSKIEINGALYKFDAEEAIGGAPADGIIYIKLTPSADTVTAEFTAAAPTWDTEKQGWYVGNNRYLDYGMTLDSGDYKEKYVKVRPSVFGFHSETQEELFSKILSGTFGSSSTSAVIAHGIFEAYTGFKILQITVHLDTGAIYTQVSRDAISNIPRYSVYDNTNVTIYRGAIGAGINFKIFIVYRR